MSKKVFLTRKPNMYTTIPPGAHGGQRGFGSRRGRLAMPPETWLT
jgi:hypothetical protein